MYTQKETGAHKGSVNGNSHSIPSFTLPAGAIIPVSENNYRNAITVETIKEEAEAKVREAEKVPGEITGELLLTNKPEKMEFFMENLLPRTGMGCLAGGSDLGKSAALRDLGIRTVAGETECWGFPLNAVHKNSIIVSSEDDEQAVAYLLSKQAQKYNPSQLRNLRFIFDYDNNLLDILDKRLSRKKADLVIIDCFADVYGGDLKDTQKIRLFLAGYQQLSAKHQCFVLFLHHTAKRTENNEPSKHNLLSGQGFEAKMRLVIELRADLMDPSLRHLCIVKGNYLPASMKRESYILRFNEDSFTFSNTNERAPFELLAKQNEDNGKAKYIQAKELKEKGYSYEKIALALGFGSKGSVTKLFEKAQKNGWEDGVS